MNSYTKKNVKVLSFIHYVALPLLLITLCML